jgi:hypothetical protein
MSSMGVRHVESFGNSLLVVQQVLVFTNVLMDL